MGKDLTFKDVCVRMVLLIFLLSAVRILFTYIYCVSEGGYVYAFVCDLSACAVLTLYFRLASLVLCYFSDNEETGGGSFETIKRKRLILEAADGAALVLKTVFLFLPGLAFGGIVYVHIAALTIDAVWATVWKIYDIRVA